jgi:hypothetical protein
VITVLYLSQVFDHYTVQVVIQRPVPVGSDVMPGGSYYHLNMVRTQKIDVTSVVKDDGHVPIGSYGGRDIIYSRSRKRYMLIDPDSMRVKDEDADVFLGESSVEEFKTVNAIGFEKCVKVNVAVLIKGVFAPGVKLVY